MIEQNLQDDCFQIADSNCHEAIVTWEKGALKEKQGSMTDAIRFYRQALKLHDNVEKLYREKVQKDWKLQKQLQELKLEQDKGSTHDDLDNDSKTFDIKNEEEIEKQELPPCWLFEMLPDDVILRIVAHTVLVSGTAWINLSLTCAKFNELCFHNSAPFKTFASYMYSRQNYEKAAPTLEFDRNWGCDYQKMLKERPYVHFEGIYISTVNYLRHGANAEGSSSLINPIHMITYYRYFRFYPDGYCLRLLTTEDPTQVVNHFSRKSPPKDSGLSRWTLRVVDGVGTLEICRTSEKYSFIEELRYVTEPTEGIKS